MDLKTLQLKLLDILKEKYIPEEKDDKYIKDILSSKNLAMLKSIIQFWRTTEIGNYCSFTSEYLKKENVFESKVKDFYLNNNFSNYIEELGKEFLRYLKKDENSLTAFVADFELSMIEVNSGSMDEYFIETVYEPGSVFSYVYSGTEFPAESETKFIVMVSAGLENNFTVIHKN